MVTKRLSKNFEAFEDFSSLVVFLAENFRKFPKKSQNVTIYGVTIYGSRLYKFPDRTLSIFLNLWYKSGCVQKTASLVLDMITSYF